jgi:hypothetical protein
MKTNIRNVLAAKQHRKNGSGINYDDDAAVACMNFL